MANKKNNDKINIEKELERLKEISTELEKGIMDLDASLKLYEEGIIIYRRLSMVLDNAQRTVEILREDGNSESFEQ